MSVEPKHIEQKEATSSENPFLKWEAMILKMSPAKRIEMEREGVQVAPLVGAGRYYGISQAKLSKLIGISDATTTRKIKSGGKLGPLESERMARIALIQAEAEKNIRFI